MRRGSRRPTSSVFPWAHSPCLHAALRHPDRVLSAVVAGAGYGSEKEHQEFFRRNSEQVAKGFEERGAEGFAPIYAESASRVQFQEKDPRGWSLFAERLAKHSAPGAANTMRGVQMRRPSLYDLEDELGACRFPCWWSWATRTITPSSRGSS